VWADLLAKLARHDGAREAKHGLCQQALDSLPLSAWTAGDVLPKHVAMLTCAIAKLRFRGDWPFSSALLL
jgi:hypothetical protein